MEDDVIIVTRHSSLVEFLHKKGITGIIISHATEDNVKGKKVYGVLPHSLSCLTKEYTEVPLRIPQEL